MQIYLQIIAAIWIIFMAFLFIPTIWSDNPVERRSPSYTRRSFIVAIIALILVITLSTYESDVLILRVVPGSTLAGITGIILTTAGLGFSSWARHHLGKYWSGMVMIRVGHQLIRSGPYRFVRNPMYSGLLTAFVGTAIVIGEFLAFVALIIGIASIWVKIKADEEILSEKFGEEYLQYKREVKAALIPWIV
jgi:protein-S-isoprenylcysteine O-methyltransferase Ste14